MYKRILIYLIFPLCAISLITYFSIVGYAQEKLKIEKVDGVVVISNPKIPVPKNGSKKRIVFKEDLSIGSVEGDENYMFGEEISFNTDEDGNFYVSDQDNKRIQKFDPEGKYLLTIGRKGQGPGEFQSLTVTRFDKNNNLYIRDTRSRRISFFNKEGKFLRQINMRGNYGGLFINSKGFYVAYHTEQERGEGTVKIVYIAGLFDDKFNSLAVFHKEDFEMSLPGQDESSMIKAYAKLASFSAFKPEETHILARNDFIYSGYPDKYEINIYSPEGKLIRKITKDYEPMPVSKKDKKNYEKELSEDPTVRGFPEEQRKKFFQLIKYPKYKPAYLSYTLIEDGWLAVMVDSIENEYTLFDIFDQEGRYIANFKTTVPVEELFFKNGKAYAVVEDEGFKFVKRYSIELQEYKGNRWVNSKIKFN